MLKSGKKIRAVRDKQKYFILVLSEKNCYEQPNKPSS